MSIHFTNIIIPILLIYQYQYEHHYQLSLCGTVLGILIIQIQIVRT